MLIAAAALAHDCVEADVDALATLQAPAVIVLGERHGEKGDMKRAQHLVERLMERGSVTLAVEAVHEKNQGTLDRYAAGEVKTGKLPRELHWDDTWGFAWKPYKKLVTGSRRGWAVVAAGLDLGPKPDEREVPLPEGYAERMMKAIEAHAHLMKPEVRERFPVSMAWRDFRIGELALEGWSGEGYLVVLTGRGHVEGGQGTNWQLAQLTDAPVHSVVLDHDGAQCLDGDRVWPD